MMINEIANYVLHFDKYLASLISSYGFFIYPLIFIVIFLETGLVITPFLPGDSLLFISGTLAGSGILNLYVLLVIFSLAAILGDNFNYFLGNYFGKRVFSRWISENNIHKTNRFYEKYGAKTIIISRFIPIIRSFAPFVAGIGNMEYSKFLFYNVIGGISWVVFFVLTGYLFGTLPFIQENLLYFIIGIIIISIIPAIIEYIKYKKD